LPVSASEAHSLANVRKTREQMVDECVQIVALRNERRPACASRRHVHGLRLHLQGAVPEDDVVRLAAALAEAGADESACPTPPAWPTRRRCGACSAVRAEIGDRTGAAHLHNTRGLGLANCLAALRRGRAHLRQFAGGLGGCPYAPGRVGQRRHRRPGVHVRSHGRANRRRPERLIAARARAARRAARRALYGMTPEAGLTKGFVYADGRAGMNAGAPMLIAEPRAEGIDEVCRATLPLSGLRVVEFTHMVMGPTCGWCWPTWVPR
jgi:hypothetical protein